MTVEEFKSRVYNLADERGWSRYRLAQEMGVSESTVKKIYERDTMPRFDTIIKICDAFGITLGDFFINDVSIIKEGKLSKNDAIILETFHCLPRDHQVRLLMMAKMLASELKIDDIENDDEQQKRIATWWTNILHITDE